MSSISFCKNNKSYNRDNLINYTSFDSRIKMKLYYANYLSRKKSLSTPNIIEKIIAFACYFTFGLAGLLFLIVSFFSERVISKFTYLHMFQSLILGIIVSVVSFFLALFTSASFILFSSLEAYQNYNSFMFTSLQLFIGIVITIFALCGLFGKKFYLPGLEQLARRFVG